MDENFTQSEIERQFEIEKQSEILQNIQKKKDDNNNFFQSQINEELDNRLSYNKISGKFFF